MRSCFSDRGGKRKQGNRGARDNRKEARQEARKRKKAAEGKKKNGGIV